MTCAEVSRDMFEQDASWLWAGVGGAGEGNAVEMMVFVQVSHTRFSHSCSFAHAQQTRCQPRDHRRPHSTLMGHYQVQLVWIA